MTFSRTLAIVAAPALLGTALVAAPAAADDHAHHQPELMATLGELNDSGGSGEVWAKVDGTSVWMSIQVNGLIDAPHAQHIHIGGTNTCPDPSMEGTGFEGAITTTDGAASYGPVMVSMTTEGAHVGADHALDVANFPMEGTYTYERTFEVPEDVAAQIAAGDGVVVVHGVDYNGNGEYDADAGMSDLDPELPAEATDPALCGTLDVSQMAAPDGGVETGGGSGAGVEAGGLLLGGLVVAVAGAGALVARQRRGEA